MKKKTKLALTFLSALSLFSCGAKTSDNPTEPKTEESAKKTDKVTETGKVTEQVTEKPVTEAPALKEITVKGKLSHFTDGFIKGATVSINDKAFVTEEGGAFNLEAIKITDEMVLRIEKTGYQTKEITLPKKDDLTAVVDLGTIELAKTYALFGKLTEKTWEKYEAFQFSTTRDKDNLYLLAESSNDVFFQSNRNSKLEAYISVGEVAAARDGNVYQIVVDSMEAMTYHCYGEKELVGEPSIKTVKSESFTSIEFAVPFAMLGITCEDILGLSFGLWSETDKDWAPMKDIEKGIVHAVETPAAYVRADKENTIFLNSKNEYYVPPTYNKEELTTGYDFQTATPEFSNKSAVADDIYMKYTKTENGFDFSFLLFGKMEGKEHLKMIFHTDNNNNNGWKTSASDLFVMLDTTSAKKKSGILDFWSYNSATNDAEERDANHLPEYKEEEAGYYTLNWSIDFGEIPNYTPTGKVTLYCMEFDDGVIYDSNPFTKGMMKNGEPLGDPADQSCYYSLQEKVIEMDTTGYPYEIARGGDNIFFKSERMTDGILLSFISDSEALNDDTFLRFTLHSGADATGGWALSATDVTFIIRKTSAKLVTGKTGFWDNEKDADPFGATTETLNAPEYKKEEKFWTLTFMIDESETGAAYTATTPLKGMAWEFKNGIIINGNTHFNNKTAVGDTALQANYFVI